MAVWMVGHKPKQSKGRERERDGAPSAALYPCMHALPGLQYDYVLGIMPTLWHTQ